MNINKRLENHDGNLVFFVGSEVKYEILSNNQKFPRDYLYAVLGAARANYTPDFRYTKTTGSNATVVMDRGGTGGRIVAYQNCKAGDSMWGNDYAWIIGFYMD